MSFNDIQYAAYFTCEQLRTFLALVFLTLLRRKLKINEIYRASISFFVGLVFNFAVATRLIALIVIL